METTEANEVQAVYTYGDDLISMKRNSGISEICGYYHYDGLGTVKQMTDSNGAVIEKYSYDAFGNSTIFSPSNETRDTSDLGNAHGFTGEQQFNEADNLVFLRARYYKSDIGRFISRDPIGYEDGMNIYAYVKNNSVNRIDPSGKSSGCEYLCTGIAATATAMCLGAIGESCVGAGACAMLGLAVYNSCMDVCTNPPDFPWPPGYPDPRIPIL